MSKKPSWLVVDVWRVSPDPIFSVALLKLLFPDVQITVKERVPEQDTDASVLYLNQNSRGLPNEEALHGNLNNTLLSQLSVKYADELSKVFDKGITGKTVSSKAKERGINNFLSIYLNELVYHYALGPKGLTLTTILGFFLVTWGEEEDGEHFEDPLRPHLTSYTKAAELCITVMKNTIRHIKGFMSEYDYIEDVCKKHKDSYVVFDHFVEGSSAEFPQLERFAIIAIPDLTRGYWSIRVNRSSKDPYRITTECAQEMLESAKHIPKGVTITPNNERDAMTLTSTDPDKQLIIDFVYHLCRTAQKQARRLDPGTDKN